METVDLGRGFHRVTTHYGFMERPDVPAMVARAMKQLNIATPPDKVVYMLGRETLVVTTRGQMDPLTEPVFAFLQRNAHSVTEYFRIPPEQVVELGAQVDL